MSRKSSNKSSIKKPPVLSNEELLDNYRLPQRPTQEDDHPSNKSLASIPENKTQIYEDEYVEPSELNKKSDASNKTAESVNGSISKKLKKIEPFGALKVPHKEEEKEPKQRHKKPKHVWKPKYTQEDLNKIKEEKTELRYKLKEINDVASTIDENSVKYGDIQDKLKMYKDQMDILNRKHRTIYAYLRRDITKANAARNKAEFESFKKALLESGYSEEQIEGILETRERFQSKTMALVKFFGWDSEIKETDVEELNPEDMHEMFGTDITAYLSEKEYEKFMHDIKQMEDEYEEETPSGFDYPIEQDIFYDNMLATLSTAFYTDIADILSEMLEDIVSSPSLYYQARDKYNTSNTKVIDNMLEYLMHYQKGVEQDGDTVIDYFDKILDIFYSKEHEVVKETWRGKLRLALANREYTTRYRRYAK